MVVDEEKKYSLNKFSSRKGEKIITESDHNMLILQLNLRWSSLYKSSRLEIYNFNNKDDFKNYQLLTENNVELFNAWKMWRILIVHVRNG